MDQFPNETELLEQIAYPAFLVKDGIVEAANYMALQRHISVGTEVLSLLCSGQQEYTEFSQGRLFLTLKVENITYNASVVRSNGMEIVYLESEFADPELRVLSAAAQHLRQPLANAMLSSEQLSADLADSQKEQCQALIHSLHRLHRALCNMSDAASYNQKRLSKIENCDLRTETAQMMEEAGELLARIGNTLQYKGPSRSFHSLIDREKLSRAVINLISNAVRYSAKGSTIYAHLTHEKQRFRVSVSNRSKVPESIIHGRLFSYYQQESVGQDLQAGIGLGITVARNAATAHGGTLLFDQPDPDTIRFTLTIPIQRNKDARLRSSTIYPVDYSGGYDHLLTELSDVLPDDLFQ